jgi:peptide/nickel transport system substrate-binding protein
MLKGTALGAGGLAAAALIACGGDDDTSTGSTGSGSTTPIKGGNFAMLYTAYWGAADPHKNVSVSPPEYSYHWVYNFLIRPNKEVQPEADLAAVPEVTDGGLTLRFTFKDGIKWQARPPVNGRAFTSEDAKKTIERIQLAENVLVRRTNVNKIASMEIPDAKTLVMKLSEPDASLLINLGFMDPILPMEQAISKDSIKTGMDWVGTGPYQMTSFDEGSGWKMIRRPDGFWKPNKAHVDTQETIMVGADDPLAESRALQAGRADRGIIAQEEFENFSKDSRFELEKTISWTTDRVTFNPARDPFKDARVRQALFLAVDRALVIQNLFSGRASLTGPEPAAFDAWALPESELTTIPGYRKTDPDLNTAKQLLSAAGLANGFNVTSFSTLASNINKASLIVPMLDKIGVKMEIQALSSLAELQQRESSGNFAMTVGAIAGSPDPYGQLGLLYETGAGRNFGNYSDPTLDKMLKDMRREFAIDKRKQMVLDIQRYILKGMAPNHTFITASHRTYAHRPYVKGIIVSNYNEGQAKAEDVYLDGKA